MDEIFEEIDRRFDFHAASRENNGNAHEAVRAGMKDAARVVLAVTPPGRERSLALTKLEEAMMWANAGIARPPQTVPLPEGHQVGPA